MPDLEASDRMGPMRRGNCEVLVIGAGPTGLMAANLLKRSGVDVRIVDERAEGSRESRAFAVVARSMELFAQLGLAERVLDRGVLNPGIDFYVGGDHVGGLDYDRADSPDTPYPFIVLHPQSNTEAVLLEDLGRLGLAVERRTRATGLDQDGDGVTTRVSGPGGEAAIRSAFVVGADGAHSTVRHALGLSFEGAKYAQAFLLADCRVEWPADSGFDHARFRVFMQGSTIALFLPLDGANRSRVMVTDHSNKADLAGTEVVALDLGELESAYREATGLDVRLAEPVWTTRYRVHHRGVSRYGVGRVFVAGDAAHIHSPAGGQGMNTGLQDAANLAWKLAAVLRNGAPPDLLDTYDAERLPVGRQVVETSDRMFSVAAGQTGWQATVRDWLARPVSAAIAHSDAVQHNAFRKLSQLEIAYPVGRYVEDAAPGLGQAGPRVGHRAPDAVLDRRRKHLRSDERIRLHGTGPVPQALGVRRGAQGRRGSRGIEGEWDQCTLRLATGGRARPAGDCADQPYRLRDIRFAGARRPSGLSRAARRLRGLARGWARPGGGAALPCPLRRSRA